jgi:hypothetical protein
MNAVPSRLVIPDSYRSNFRPFYLQPPHAFLSFCSLCSPEDRSRIFRSPFAGRIPFLASSLESRLANASGRIEFIIVLFMDWSFASGCSPPRLSTTQLPSATDRPVLLSDGDFHPTLGAYSQAHFPRPFGPKPPSNPTHTQAPAVRTNRPTYCASRLSSLTPSACKRASYVSFNLAWHSAHGPPSN